MTSLTAADCRRARELIYQLAGISLSDAKAGLIEARLARRVRALGLPGYGPYLDVVANDQASEERVEFINALTTNKTAFYREPHHFTFLKNEILARRRPSDPPVRIWCAASSMGHEPYTIAMTAKSAGVPVSILASDIDTKVLETARQAVYPLADFADLAPELWQQHCLRGSGSSAGYVRIKPDVANLVEFEQINLIDSAWRGLGPFDVIFCRNVIIYFDRPTQETLMERFSQVIRPGGWLMLGHSEALTWLAPRFEPLGQTVYRKPGGAVQAAGETPSGPAPAPLVKAAPALKEHRIIAGGVYANDTPSIVRTLLGSCVAACLFDPVKGIGGMNHFMLPSSSNDDKMPARFGVHAMELLINKIMALGGDRRRLKAKVFGASSVIEALREGAQVAPRNAAFVREFLAAEGIPIVAERMGGTEPLEVRFHIHSGRAQVRAVAAKTVDKDLAEERRYQAKVVAEAVQQTSTVELF